MGRKRRGKKKKYLTFGQAIRQAREDLGLTQVQCAALVGTATQGWHFWEVDKRSPTLRFAIPIMVGLRMSDELILSVMRNPDMKTPGQRLLEEYLAEAD